MSKEKKKHLRDMFLVGAIIVMVMLAHVVGGVLVTYVSDRLKGDTEVGAALVTALPEQETIPITEDVQEVVTDEVVPDISKHDASVPYDEYDYWKDVSGYGTNVDSAAELLKAVNEYLLDNGYNACDTCYVGNYSCLESGTWGVDVTFESVPTQLFVYYDGFNDEFTVSEWE